MTTITSISICLISFALLLGAAALYIDKTSNPSPTNDSVSKVTPTDSALPVLTDIYLLNDFELVFNEISRERFKLDYGKLVAETGFHDNGTELYRFSCLKKNPNIMEETELTVLRKQLNKMIQKIMQLKARELSSCTDEREYKNITLRNPYLCSCGFAVDNVCQTNSAVIFEIYILNTNLNCMRFQNSGK